jgi:metallophosphoesterase superfamily enzyme
MLPPYDTRETLTRLAEVIDRYEPDRVIALGDSFHDTGAAERMSGTDLEILRLLQEDREWIWLTAIMTPTSPMCSAGASARSSESPASSCATSRHLAASRTRSPATCIPAARISVHGYIIRRPCFVANGRRLVMPAFGAFAGGLNVLDEAFHPLFGDGGMAVWMLGQAGLFPSPPACSARLSRHTPAQSVRQRHNALITASAEQRIRIG